MNLSNVNLENLRGVFSFSQEENIVWGQYMMYFEQFMLDLGLPVDVEIQTGSDQVRFFVKPRTSERLEEVREFLDYYLQAPQTKDFSKAFSFERDDIAVTQWKNNVQHLLMQLDLLKSIEQLRNESR